MARRTRLAPTDKNLFEVALQPVFIWLVAAALDGDTLPYGAIKDRIEIELGFRPIGRSTRIGKVVGKLMHEIEAVDSTAPLINALVVGQGDGLPGSGAGSFMADHFDVPRLRATGAKVKYPNLWREYSVRSADEVHAKDADYWRRIHQKVFRSLAADLMERERTQRKLGTEEDGLPDNVRRYGGKDGESKGHKSLRLWVEKHPQRVDPRLAGADSETEFDLLPGDRVDVMLRHRTKWIALEVKSRRSNDADYERGVYQCVMYRAVLEAMDMRQLAQSKLGNGTPLKGRKLVEACLITETDPGPKIAALLSRQVVKLYVVPQTRQM